MVEPDEKCISVVHYFSGGAPLNIQRDRYYWKKKKEATHFLPKMEVNYGSSFGGGTGSKTDLGMPAGKKPLWKSTISFWFTVGFSHTQVEAAQAFLPLLKQALEVRCHMWEIIHRLWRDISHVSSSKSRFFFRFWESCYSHWFTPWMQSSNVMFNCFEMQNSNCCISSQGFSSGLRNLILRVINTLVLKVAPILLYFCAVPYFGQTFQPFRKIKLF